MDPPTGTARMTAVVTTDSDGRRTGWLFTPAPLARVAWLRVLAYLFVPVDLLLTTPWVVLHAQVPAELYVPLRLGRVLQLPAPGPWVEVLQVVLVAAALAAAVLSARAAVPRWLGVAVALGYLQWMVVAMSYGKVDHDRVAFLVLLAALPTVGRAALRDHRASEAAGWAVQVTALAVVATYTLAAVAKLRFGGVEWVDGATLTRAVLRRGTPLSTWLLDVPGLLLLLQYAIIAMELAVAPLLLVRWRRAAVGWALAAGFLAFHAVTFAAITIVFLPHCVALLALLPLERLPLERLPLGRLPLDRLPLRRRADARSPE